MQEELQQNDLEQPQDDLSDVVASTHEADGSVELQGSQESPEVSQLEAAPDTANDAEQETQTEKPVDSVQQKERGHTHTAFLEALEAHAQALGLKTLTQTSFVQFLEPGTGHKLYVGRTARDTTPVRVETTLPVLDRIAGATPPAKENGKIAAVLPPEMEVVMQVMQLLASKELGPIRSAKRISKPAEK